MHILEAKACYAQQGALQAPFPRSSIAACRYQPTSNKFCYYSNTARIYHCRTELGNGKLSHELNLDSCTSRMLQATELHLGVAYSDPAAGPRWHSPSLVCRQYQPRCLKCHSDFPNVRGQQQIGIASVASGLVLPVTISSHEILQNIMQENPAVRLSYSLGKAQPSLSHDGSETWPHGCPHPPDSAGCTPRDAAEL
jgi:hypothetical protein